MVAVLSDIFDCGDPRDNRFLALPLEFASMLSLGERFSRVVMSGEGHMRAASVERDGAEEASGRRAARRAAMLVRRVQVRWRRYVSC